MKQIHFYPYAADVKYNTYCATKKAIAREYNFIETNHMSFLSTSLFDIGYSIYIHESEKYFYEIMLGDNRPLTNIFIAPEHDLFEL